ncbi:MAG: VanZ family protein [Lachnospiraceae bacterium]|nr:VanZ family protein [Lachnospiraceae bacterium]
MSETNNKNPGSRLLKVLYVTTAVTLLLIWGQSCISKSESTVSSDIVVEMIKPIDELEQGYRSENGWTYVELSTVVRKLAHVVEYAALSFQLMCILLLKKKGSIKVSFNCLFGIVLVALTDETIQLFSDRGSEIRDVWIDMAGAVLGVAVAHAIGYLVRRKLKKADRDKT